MSEKEFNLIFSGRLRHYLELYEMTQAELAKRLGVGTTSVSNWVNGIKTPRMDKVDAMCEIFHCSRSDLIVDPDDEHKNAQDTWYYDSDTRQIADRIKTDSHMRILFDAARDAKPEDLEKAASFIRFLKEQQNGSEE